MPTRELELKYFDGSIRTVSINETEKAYPIGRLIVSYTDVKGVILHANKAFIDISGYAKEELIGQPHHILRHPDMPKSAFQDMWYTIQAGKNWYGHVKNLCKNGEFYWVYATVVPSFDKEGAVCAYTSIRRMPSRAKIEEAIELYKTMA